MTSPRRFPPPWQVEQIPGGFKVLDANGQALAYVYARETKAQADIAKVLTFDEERRNPPLAFVGPHQAIQAQNSHSASVTAPLGRER